MDQIQKVLVKLGHKDLDQEYYRKATTDWIVKLNKEDDKLHKLYHSLWDVYRKTLEAIDKAAEYAKQTLKEAPKVDVTLQNARRPILEKKLKEYRAFKTKLTALQDDLLTWNTSIKENKGELNGPDTKSVS